MKTDGGMKWIQSFSINTGGTGSVECPTGYYV